MKLTVTQAVEQKQILSLSLYQLQSLNILSLGNSEIGNLLKQEYTENPFLEQKEMFTQEELQWLKYYKANAGLSAPVSASHDSGEEHQQQYAARGDYDWRQDIREQLYRRGSDRGRIRKMERLIELLDEHGFLEQDDKALSRMTGLTRSEVKKYREELAALEPRGLGCRNMGEYFLYQIRANGIQVPKALETLCLNHLDDITSKPYTQIARQIQASFQEVRRWIQFLGTLQPYPIDQAEEEPAEYIIPDITIEFRGGEWQVKVNDYYMRQYCISDFYSGMRRQADDPVMREYMDAKLLRARQLCETITKRNNTVWSLGNYLLKTQRSFFEGGLLQGLTYKACGEALGIHESTVCRVVANKYVACPQGILPLAFFFSKGVKVVDQYGHETGTIGKASVKELIAAYIHGESGSKPLSDMKIANLLKAEYGLLISKRTVTNYREEMGIHSVYERRRDGET